MLIMINFSTVLETRLPQLCCTKETQTFSDHLEHKAVERDDGESQNIKGDDRAHWWLFLILIRRQVDSSKCFFMKYKIQIF